MKKLLYISVLSIACAQLAWADGDYRGDARCVPPKDWSAYSEPYWPIDHPHDYPTFPKATVPGWSCSYQRADGVIVQFGDSRTPQQQWLDVWSGGDTQQ
jgi:hypothetical protein